MCAQRGTVECAGALFSNNDVPGLWLELRSNGIVRRVDGGLYPLGGAHERRTAGATHVASRIENRQTRCARSGKEQLGRFNRFISILAAGTGILFGDFVRRMRTAAINKLIKVDCEKRRCCPYESLAFVTGINLENVRSDDIFPAMVLKILGHISLLARTNEDTCNWGLARLADISVTPPNVALPPETDIIERDLRV